MRKSLLMAAMYACLPMCMSDVQAAGAPLNPEPAEGGAAEAGKPVASSSSGTSNLSLDTSLVPRTPTTLSGSLVQGEQGNASAAPDAAASTNPNATGNPDASQPLTSGDPALGGDAPNGAAVAADQPGMLPSAPAASSPAGTSGIVANSPAEPKTFEQLVEERFLKLERAVVQLPHSIRTVMSEGSHGIEVFTQKVLSHLFANI